MTTGASGVGGGAAEGAGVTITPEPPRKPEVIALLHASDAFAAALYPAESNHLLDLAALEGPGVAFRVARRSGTALGCGALVVQPGGWGEVKRMFLVPHAHGLGIGRRPLAALEAEGRARGLTALRLETGIRQPAALALYRSAGWIDRGPFGSYGADPLSVFLERPLT